MSEEIIVPSLRTGTMMENRGSGPVPPGPVDDGMPIPD
jgi:hypothetical protein